MIEKLFFELIRVAIGTQNTLSRQPSGEEWMQLYNMAQKQSLIGVCFAGIQRLGADADEGFTRIGMGEMLYLTWMGMTAKIQQRNEVMNGYTSQTLEMFRKEGFNCQVLKGQGIAPLYGDLDGLRQSGDVDVWVDGSRKRLYDFSIAKFGKLEGLTYHHIHFPAYEDCEIEAHTWPAFFTNPFVNKRFHKFCKLYEPYPDCHDTPSLAFNRVFILQHCYGHFCGHGVGLRQLLDYYFVLIQGYTEVQRLESMRWIECLGMNRFCAALMWVMKYVFGMEDKYLICKPAEKDGRFLLAEVMQTGNMGHQDERVDHRKLQNAFGRYLHNIKRDWQVIRIAPNYALWEPLWGIFQFIWCKLTQMKYKR